MVDWSEYKQLARERGSLALEWYVVESRPEAAPEVVREHLPAHLEYQAEQERAGRLVLAGPLSDDSGERMSGGGLIVYRAESLDAARAIAAADPMHVAGARGFTIRRWLVNEGSLNLSLRLSGQAVDLG